MDNTEDTDVDRPKRKRTPGFADGLSQPIRASSQFFATHNALGCGRWFMMDPTTCGWSQVITRTPGIKMRFASLPQTVATFLPAVEERDSPRLLATFTPDAILTDMGKEHRGKAIEKWNDRRF